MMHDFELRIRVGPRSEPSLLEAEVHSLLLDPILHPDGSCSAMFMVRTIPKPDDWREIELSSFQLQSLIEYVGMQEYVKDAVGAALSKDRADWLNSDEVLPPGDIWRHARVQGVYFDPRLVRTMDDPKFPAELLAREDMMEEIVALSDKPDTRATFMVIIMADWDTDHGPRTAVFRDGRLSHFGIEGS